MTNQSFAGKRFFRTVLTIVIALVLLVTMFAGTAFAKTSDEYTVSIVDGSRSVAVTTTETEPIEILKSAGIVISAGDKLDISDFKESEGGSIVVNRLNTIYVEFDGNITAYQIYSHTVGEAFSQLGVNVKNSDQINYSLNTEITDGMVIKITSAQYVTLKADGTEAKFALTNGTVADLLKTAGVTLGKDDYTEPSLDSKLEKNLVIKVKRVEYKTVEKTEEVKYSTVETKDKSLEDGKKKVITKGENGEVEVTYKVRFVNGKEKDSTEVSRIVTKEATKQEVVVGTKKTEKKKSKKDDDSSSEVKANGVKSKNGYKLGQVIKGRYSHYCACATCNGNSRGITSSGKKIKNGMDDPHYVACNWLPLGTVISVDGTNYTVVDRGGSGLSRQGRIDIFTPGGHSECYKLGVGGCTIEIVRLGW
ncbi:3D domain-containing protein [uncultured Eubacterium sp.]|uniref:3D domain-containing protein n=1 Tax=uncultured Eubacterium sp. TaxID=165185 RepID=UPI002618F663|nr:3D domain-containing protein [uncultured Eubacterium sp.]